MKHLIEKALAEGKSYSEYRTHITDLLAEGKVTGHTQTEALVGYSDLNTTRMKRLDKTIKLIDGFENETEKIKEKYTLLILSEGWCGDAAQALPVLNIMTEANDKLDLKIISRDENIDLMNLFLTNGGQAIPKVLVVKQSDLSVIGDWGPRPGVAQKMILDYKKENGVIDEQIKIDLQKWYLKDKGISTQKEIIALF